VASFPVSIRRRSGPLALACSVGAVFLLGCFALAPPRLAAQSAPGVQSMNPDFSALGDFLIDLSPRSPTFTEDGKRFSLREVELGIQGAVDPFFRADLFLGLHGGEISVEEGYLTALLLPGQLQARLGRFLLPMGKVNLTHRPELLTLEYPLAIRTYFSEEGFRGTGASVSRLFAPFGVFQELQLFVLNGIEGEGHGHDHGNGDDHGHDHGPAEELVLGGPDRRGLEQLGSMAHLRTFFDLGVASNVEVGASFGIGTVERYLRPGRDAAPVGGERPDVLRTYRIQRLWGTNVIYRWRPPERGLYRSFRLEGEAFVHDGPEAPAFGGFAQTQLQVGRRTYVAGRIDAVQRPGSQHVEAHGQGVSRHVHIDTDSGGEWLHAASAYWTFFPSEFSRLRLGVERTFGDGWGERGSVWRAALQTTFSLGPHRPHPF